MAATPSVASRIRPNRIRGIVGATIALGLALAGCADGDSTKAGDRVSEPVTLRMGTPDFPGRLGADQIDTYARRVEDLSKGAIRIEPVYQASGPFVRQWDQGVARMVVSGELDMGLVPARAWDTEGVTSMQALHAPFLVTSSALLEQIVLGDIGAEMIAGLEPAGVTGLALIPEHMRYVFSYGPAFATPESFEGATIRAPWSATSNALYEALGASVVDLNGAEFEAALRRSELDGLDTSFGLPNSDAVVDPVSVAGDLRMFPKVNTMVANSDLFAELTDDQREILRRAAIDATLHAIDVQASEAALARAFCETGGEVVLVGEQGRSAFVAAAAPVYALLEGDAQTARMIRDIRELTGRLAVDSGDTIAACEPDAASVDGEKATQVEPTPTESTKSDPETEIDGVYRVEWTAEWLREQLEPYVDEVSVRGLVASDVGVWELTFDRSRFEMSKVGGTTSCFGSYRLRGGRIVITASSQTNSECGTNVLGQDIVDAQFEIAGDELRLSDFELPEEVNEIWWYALLGVLPPRRTA